MIHVLSQEMCKFLEVEDLERATGRNLADGGGQKAVVVVAVAGLHEDGAVRETFRVDFRPREVQTNA